MNDKQIKEGTPPLLYPLQLKRKWGTPSFRKCLTCGSNASGLCWFPLGSSCCDSPTCDDCGSGEGESLRCAEHKGKTATAADEYDLSL